MIFNIITAVSRVENIHLLKENIEKELLPYFEVKWYCIYDIGKGNFRYKFNEPWIINLTGGKPNDCAGGSQRNMALNEIQEGWVYCLDDDNLLYENFGKIFYEKLEKNPNIKIFIFNQKRFGDKFDLIASKENVKIGYIDIAQFVGDRKAIGDIKFEENLYQSDCDFILRVLYQTNKKSVMFINQLLAYYNYLRQDTIEPNSFQKEFINYDSHVFYNLIKDYGDIYFITGYGNVGDFLIYEGTRAILKKFNVKYKEIHISAIKHHKGQLALLCGGGAWCKVFNHYMPQNLPLIEAAFDNTIVLPSSFDTEDASVKNAITASNALFLCREEVSYNQLNDICRAQLMHDHAFHFDYSKYKKNGSGELNAFRIDGETHIPYQVENNSDISNTNITLEEWLNELSKYQVINTDRAHIMVASAMMGKEVNYRKTSYHKLPAIAEYSLRELPVKLYTEK